MRCGQFSLGLALLSSVYSAASCELQSADGCATLAQAPAAEDEVTLFQTFHHRHHVRAFTALNLTRTGDGVLQGPVTETTYESWFERLGDSIGSVAFGIVLIIFSVPVLWFNESRTAQMESIIALGKESARTVEDDKAQAENHNWLVHIQGAPTHGAARVADKQFDVAFETGCIQLSSTVEVYQVIEHAEKKEKEKLGGGKEITTTYTYTEEWSGMWHDSKGFREARQKGRNKKPQGLELGGSVEICSRVEYGSGFLLSDDLVRQCSGFKSAAEELGDTVKLKAASTDFKRDGEWYYYRTGRQSETQVGDARVRFTYVPDGAATVMALQTPKASDTRASFLPYRLIRRPWFFSLSEEAEKKALKAEAQKTSDQLAEEAMCTGCLGCLCCACNLVICCCASLLTSEINHLFVGSLDQYSCFQRIEKQNTLMKWLLRLAGWVMMFTGMYMLFDPFLTLITVIPLLGPILAKLGGFLIWFVCLFCTLIWSSVIVMVAFLFYRPKTALLYGLGIAAIVVSTLFLINLAQ